MPAVHAATRRLSVGGVSGQRNGKRSVNGARRPMFDLLEDWFALWFMAAWVWMDPHAPIEVED
jgi:hypothetical protein